MDPDAALRNIFRCLLYGEVLEAQEHAQHLFDWLEHGGFHPNWQEETINFVCELVNHEEFK